MNTYNAICRTNLDVYNSGHFPVLSVIPRIGEKVTVSNGSISHYQNKGLPTRLEVVDVTYHQDYAEVELWYRKHDVEAYKATDRTKILFGQ